MTDEKQQDDGGDATPGGVTAPAEEESAARDANAPAGAAPVPRPSRLPLTVAAAALLVALGAAAAAGYLWLAGRGPDALAESNRRGLAQASDGLAELRSSVRDAEQRLQQLGARDRELADDLDGLSDTLQGQLEPLASVPGRLSSLEASLAALQGVSSGVRDTWLLAEAEYYMEIANAQLQLASNAELAKIALELADERIAQIASPGLTDVRRALSGELRELEALDAPDIEGAALTLSSLADTVESLPLKNSVLPPAQRDVEVDEQLSGLQRALQSLKNAMRDVVSVRRTDQPLKPLLPPDAAYFLRSNLTLQLQAARLALLRGEQALFEQSLDDAAKWIGEYFDTARTPVASALETIAELRSSQTSAPQVDISRSLKLLRRFMALEAQERKADAGQPQ